MKDLNINYKLLIIVPLALLAVSCIILVSNYYSTGEWFKRSIDLRGGTLITIKTAEPVDTVAIEELMSKRFGSVSVRGMRSFGEYGALIKLDAETDHELVMQELERNGVEVKDFSLEQMGPALSSVFWSQAQIGIIVAFILMGIISFAVFRTAVPSIAIIASAASDIVVTLALMQVFGIEFSLASLGALLMLIGYSVDTDIMLTTKLLKETEGSITENLNIALKTGLTMTITSIGAVAALLLIPLPEALVQIASVLFIGLSVDIVNTWMMNSVIMRAYCERR